MQDLRGIIKSVDSRRSGKQSEGSVHEMQRAWKAMVWSKKSFGVFTINSQNGDTRLKPDKTKVNQIKFSKN